LQLHVLNINQVPVQVDQLLMASVWLGTNEIQRTDA